MKTYKHRTLEYFFEQARQQFPVLLVTGPRQVGKTTFLRYLKNEERAYVTLDDPVVRTLAKEDPALFLQRFPPPVLIDEIQYAPEILSLIKMDVDQKKVPDAYWLTGSQQFHLMQGISESLAGRVGIVQLLGFSLRELNGFHNIGPFNPSPDQLKKRVEESASISLHSLYSRIWRGSFPSLALDKSSDPNLFFSSYIQTYLQRDVRALTKVGDERSFLRFLRAAAARTGQLLNMSEMARDADVSPATAKSWTSVLEASGIIFLLEPYHTNQTKRIVKAPKLYFLDTGLCSYLTEWSSPKTLEAGAMSGAILETWVVTEILKSYWHAGKRAPLYYYRDKDKKEVDLLIVQNNTIFPLEIKKTSSPKKEHVRHFKVLDKLNKSVGPGGIICLSPSCLPVKENINSIPVAHYKTIVVSLEITWQDPETGYFR